MPHNTYIMYTLHTDIQKYVGLYIYKHKYFYLHQHCGTLVFKCAVVKKLSKEIYEDLLEVTTYFYFVSHQLTRIMLVIFYGFSAT